MSSKMNGKPKSRHSFSLDEDQKLIQLVEKYGEKNNWKKIAQKMPNRDARQCRDRWNHYLSPSNNSSEWKNEEDQKLMQLYNENGRKWSTFKSHFPGRTAVNIKSRWYKLNQEMIKSNKSQNNSMLIKKCHCAPIPLNFVFQNNHNLQMISYRKYNFHNQFPMNIQNPMMKCRSPSILDSNVNMCPISCTDPLNLQKNEIDANKASPSCGKFSMVGEVTNSNEKHLNNQKSQDDKTHQPNLTDISSIFNTFDEEDLDEFYGFDPQQSFISDSFIFL